MKTEEEFVKTITNRMEELAMFGILIKGDELDKNNEYGYQINPKFLECVKEHEEIQNKLEHVDKLRGINSIKEYGGYDRDDYIIGISINDFLNLTPKGCEKCMDITIRYRLDPEFGKKIEEHVKKEHRDIYEKQEQVNSKINEWVFVLNRILNKSKEKEWRSK